MRLLFCLLLAGCAGNSVTTTTATNTCRNVTDEATVTVPYQWDVKDDTQTTTMTDGCSYTLTVHYVMESDSVGVGGSAVNPLCAVDGCNSPPDRVGYSDPIPESFSGSMR